MNFANRLVIDTRTLVSAVLRPQSIPRQAFLKAIASATVCVSPATLAELERVLMRDKFDRYLDRDSRWQFVERYRSIATLLPVTIEQEKTLLPPCRDPQDHKFLALALHCSAQLIISSDEDLLVLSPWQNIPILTPAQYLQ
ncbi:putative toxin-antitoxin system toxin component, PIN family [Methylomonas montana]|uniref:putative toxin-antitoxin system toxin component, PIN family n=1 Tax=Methylomonas montana TaxID=3058963 RepID=UPI002658BF92|nr:putative toxin-antitoxin system toxin component, PIN family [Methylomonas montana]WKJ88898.1 putative toxin-antitoxin system toxin component, PIN family [Methylomonas montana]